MKEYRDIKMSTCFVVKQRLIVHIICVKKHPVYIIKQENKLFGHLKPKGHSKILKLL